SVKTIDVSCWDARGAASLESVSLKRWMAGELAERAGEAVEAGMLGAFDEASRIGGGWSVESLPPRCWLICTSRSCGTPIRHPAVTASSRMLITFQRLSIKDISASPLRANSRISTVAHVKKLAAGDAMST